MSHSVQRIASAKGRRGARGSFDLLSLGKTSEEELLVGGSLEAWEEKPGGVGRYDANQAAYFPGRPGSWEGS